MRSIAFIWAVAVISAALAQGAGAQEKIRLAQSSTVTNCMECVAGSFHAVSGVARRRTNGSG